MPKPTRRRSAAIALPLILMAAPAALAQEAPTALPDTGQVAEPGLRIGMDPQLTQALGRLDTAQQDMARLEEVLRGDTPADPTTDPAETERDAYAKEVIDQALLALDDLEEATTTAALDDTRDALATARRTLSAPQVAEARKAMDTLEDRLIETANAEKGAEPATD